MNNNEFGIEQQTISKLLSAGKNGSEALTLYTFYRYLTALSKNQIIKSKPEEYRKQLKWGEIKFEKADKILRDLELIKKVPLKDNKGKIISWYIIIN